MFKHWITPQVIKTFSSKYNQNIKVVRFGNTLRLDMGGLTQSGNIITSIWKKAFSNLLAHNYSPKKILVLGLGGGSVLGLISRRWPYAQITAVEIDPVVIKIAKKYFSLDKTNNLTVINQDAIEYLKNIFLSPTHQYIFDLTILDCYQGDQVPEELENLDLLELLINHSAHTLLNRLYWDEYKTKTDLFSDKLKTQFLLETTQTASNLIISLK